MLTIEQLSKFRAGKTLLTVGAIEAHARVMDCDPDEADMARAMIQRNYLLNSKAWADSRFSG